MRIWRKTQKYKKLGIRLSLSIEKDHRMVIREIILPQKRYHIIREDTSFKTKRSSFNNSKNSKTVTSSNHNIVRNPWLEKGWTILNPKNQIQEFKQNYPISTR